MDVCYRFFDEQIFKILNGQWFFTLLLLSALILITDTALVTQENPIISRSRFVLIVLLWPVMFDTSLVNFVEIL